MRNLSRTILVFAALVCGNAGAAEILRIDASSNAKAEASWNTMTERATPERRQQLQVAMLKLNMAGVNSAYDVVNNPELQNLGIARIKEKVSGLTADEIIGLADRRQVGPDNWLHSNMLPSGRSHRNPAMLLPQ